MDTQETLRGVIRGNTIVLEHPLDVPDGQEVSVTVSTHLAKTPAGEGLRRSFGAWADAGDELEEFLARIRAERHLPRSEQGI